jgi:hypothetical protein
MAFYPANDVYLSVDGTNIAAYCSSIEVNYTVDSIDTTTFAAGGHTYQGGMTDGSVSVSGTYDDTASGPKAVVEPLMRDGDLVACVYRPEGTGTGKPEQSFNVLVTTYGESSAVGDMIKWSSEMQVSGAVTDSVQS